MKKNIRKFETIAQLENVICTRARILLGDRNKQICVNPLRDMLRQSANMVKSIEGGFEVDDDFIAKIAREIKEETLYHDGL